MRFKDLFTVPAGRKVTEKHLRRVLISSICSILLCMSCLVSTTWAWYIVDIENTENVIQIGVPQVKVTVGETLLEEGQTSVELPSGFHEMTIEHANVPDAFSRKSNLYVTLTIEGTESQYIVLNHDEGYVRTINIIVGQSGTESAVTDGATEGESTPKTTKTISWQVTWFAPTGATMLIGDTIDLTNKVEETTPPSESTEEESSEPSTESSESAPVVTEPSESTDPTTESTAATQPSTEVTQPPAETTQPTTAPTEPSTPPAPSESTEETKETTDQAGGVASDSDATE